MNVSLFVEMFLPPEPDSQQPAELLLSLVRDPHRPRLTDARQPLQFKQSLEQRRSQSARQVMTPLCPIQALAGEAAAAGFHSRHVNSQLLKPEPPIRGNPILPVLRWHKQAALLQRIVDFNRECAGKMAVAGAGKLQRVGRPRFA